MAGQPERCPRRSTSTAAEAAGCRRAQTFAPATHRQQRKRRVVEQANQSVERCEFERRAVEVNDERQQRPGVKMISQLGAVLPEEHEQADAEIDQADEGEVEAALKVARRRRNAEINV